MPASHCRLTALDHVTLLSTDLQRTERFYCGLLGMRRGPRPAIQLRGFWLYVGNQPVLHVLQRKDEAGVGSGPVIDHFAFAAEWRTGFEQRLEAAGQPYESRRLADSNTWQVFVFDPDGVRVELSFDETSCLLRG
ncbi:MAG: VOC family protein [Rubrivivax sp.]|nr:VOC family protein [Rubrivivax sp.]